MAVSGDLLAQNFSCFQTNKMPSPPTIASAATVAPITQLSFITGTTQIATITPPLTGYHVLIFIFTNGSPGALLTSGNIKRAVTPVQNIPVVLYYDPSTALYWPDNGS